ncbi:MAG: KilA-N domain-containing protein [Leptolyngbya sp. SIO3F4]|nr:KilA-N domain-containing protein [Leptolyngbya sp. SIO3F4]
MADIVQHNYDGSPIPQRKEDGYVCLTDMAKATGKKVANYFELKSTKAYLEGLSLDIGIPISKLTEIIQGRGDTVEQGTWAHPEIAIDFAKWCSVPFRLWANRTLRYVIEEQAKPEPTHLIEQAKGVMELVHLALKNVSLGNTPQQSESLKAGAAISAAQVISPAISEALMPAQKLLAATNTLEVVYLTPTSLGERLGISARTVNTTLINMGLQFKNMNPSKGEPSYLPTEEGKPYSMMTAASGKSGDMTTYQHLKWSERVLELFKRTTTT